MPIGLCRWRYQFRRFSLDYGDHNATINDNVATYVARIEFAKTGMRKVNTIPRKDMYSRLATIT
jgi:hypothetical protein